MVPSAQAIAPTMNRIAIRIFSRAAMDGDRRGKRKNKSYRAPSAGPLQVIVRPAGVKAA